MRTADSSLEHPSITFVNILDSYGYTPLHHATAERAIDSMATLMAHNANLIRRTLSDSSFYPE